MFLLFFKYLRPILLKSMLHLFVFCLVRWWYTAHFQEKLLKYKGKSIPDPNYKKLTALIIQSWTHGLLLKLSPGCATDSNIVISTAIINATLIKCRSQKKETMIELYLRETETALKRTFIKTCFLFSSITSSLTHAYLTSFTRCVHGRLPSFTEHRTSVTQVVTNLM